MPEYLAPGVYVEEIERGPRPIEGVPTGTAAFIGETERGPTTPRLVTSEADYRRWFGGSFGGGDRYMPHAVQGFFANGGRRLHVCRVVGADSATASMSSGDFSVRAIGAGAWGNRVWVALCDSVQAAAGTASPRFRLQAAYWSSAPDGFEPLDPFARANKNRQSAPTLMEEFDGLSIDEASPDHFRRRLDGISTLVTLDGPPGSEPARSTGALLGAGADAADGAGVDDFIGEPTATRTEAQGLAALGSDACRDVALIHAPRPARDAQAIARELIAHCEQHRFRFAVIDGARGESHIAALDPRAALADSSFAAFYHPWLQATDPATGAPVLVPPGGHVLGIYARIDTERGVFKAPANEVVRGIVDLEFSIGKEAQELLSPRGVNLIRRFEGRGIRVWGSRTLSSDPEWKYVPIRRLFIFIERSIQQGTQWAVFEPNDDRLWTRLSDAVLLFLRTQWRAGALLGATEEQAFFVRCDRTTMTQNDVDNGRLVCEVGIAPLRPAEFVIFRIVQQTADAQR